nr:uncharacterized protein LOC113822465 [Penaeus vannamei]
MYRLEDKLSSRLYGFLPQHSTHHCLLELYTRLSSTSLVAFLDLKSAFDIANPDVILNQLMDFGVSGNLLRWIQGYLSNRSSYVLFKGACSKPKYFGLGTPLGGVLSPFLFNILIPLLISKLPDIPGTTITCYADDICVHSNSPEDLQPLIHSFYLSSSSFGLIISPERSRIFIPQNPQTLPEFSLGPSIIPFCTQYIYLGSPRLEPGYPTILLRSPFLWPEISKLHLSIQYLITYLQLLVNSPGQW